MPTMQLKLSDARVKEFNNLQDNNAAKKFFSEIKFEENCTWDEFLIHLLMRNNVHLPTTPKGILAEWQVEDDSISSDFYLNDSYYQIKIVKDPEVGNGDKFLKVALSKYRDEFTYNVDEFDIDEKFSEGVLKYLQINRTNRANSTLDNSLPEALTRFNKKYDKLSHDVGSETYSSSRRLNTLAPLISSPLKNVQAPIKASRKDVKHEEDVGDELTNEEQNLLSRIETFTINHVEDQDVMTERQSEILQILTKPASGASLSSTDSSTGEVYYEDDLDFLDKFLKVETTPTSEILAAAKEGNVNNVSHLINSGKDFKGSFKVASCHLQLSQDLSYTEDLPKYGRTIDAIIRAAATRENGEEAWNEIMAAPDIMSPELLTHVSPITRKFLSVILLPKFNTVDTEKFVSDFEIQISEAAKIRREVFPETSKIDLQWGEKIKRNKKLFENLERLAINSMAPFTAKDTLHLIQEGQGSYGSAHIALLEMAQVAVDNKLGGPDKTGMTLLGHAIRNGNKDAVDLMIKGGVDFNARTRIFQDSEFYSPIKVAAKEGRADIVQALINVGAGFDDVIDEVMLNFNLYEKGSAERDNVAKVANVIISSAITSQESNCKTALSKMTDRDSEQYKAVMKPRYNRNLNLETRILMAGNLPEQIVDDRNAVSGIFFTPEEQETSEVHEIINKRNPPPQVSTTAKESGSPRNISAKATSFFSPISKLSTAATSFMQNAANTVADTVSKSPSFAAASANLSRKFFESMPAGISQSGSGNSLQNSVKGDEEVEIVLNDRLSPSKGTEEAMARSSIKDSKTKSPTSPILSNEWMEQESDSDEDDEVEIVLNDDLRLSPSKGTKAASAMSPITTALSTLRNDGRFPQGSDLEQDSDFFEMYEEDPFQNIRPIVEAHNSGADSSTLNPTIKKKSPSPLAAIMKMLSESAEADPDLLQYVQNVILGAATMESWEDVWQEITSTTPEDGALITNPKLLEKLDPKVRNFLAAILPEELVLPDGGVSDSFLLSPEEKQATINLRATIRNSDTSDDWKDRAGLNMRVLAVVSGMSDTLDQRSYRGPLKDNYPPLVANKPFNVNPSSSSFSLTSNRSNESAELALTVSGGGLVLGNAESSISISKTSPAYPVIKGFLDLGVTSVLKQGAEYQFTGKEGLSFTIPQDIFESYFKPRALKDVQPESVASVAAANTNIDEDSKLPVEDPNIYLKALRLTLEENKKEFNSEVEKWFFRGGIPEEESIERYAQYLNVKDQYHQKLKQLWDKDKEQVMVDIKPQNNLSAALPSTSPRVITAEKISTTLYKPIDIHEESIWNPNKTKSGRGNKLKVIDGVYGVAGEDDQNAIEQTLFDIIAKVANKHDLGIERVLGIIGKARDKGGIKNKWEEKVGDNGGHYSPAESVDPVDKIFSRDFQRECEACGILSGRGTSSRGLRTTFIPLSVTQELEKLSKEGRSTLLKGEAQDGKIVSETAEDNLKNRKEVVVEKTANKSHDSHEV